MTIVIPDPDRPEILIQFSVDIGNGVAGVSRNYVRVVRNGTERRWQVSDMNPHLVVVNASGTVSSLLVGISGVDVYDPAQPTENPHLFVVDTSTQSIVATPTPPVQPVQQPGPPAQQGTGLVFL